MSRPAPRQHDRIRPVPKAPAPRRKKLAGSWRSALKAPKKFPWREKRRKILCSSALALTLTVGFDAAAQAQQPAVRSQQAAFSETAKTGKHEKKIKIDPAFSPQRLENIEAKMALAAPGRELLQFAKDEHIDISMSDTKTMKVAKQSDVFVKGRNYSTYILLNGETAKDDEIMMTIAHELRHSWHERVIKSGDLALDPRRHWLLRRLQEADAFAFEVHFGYEYEKATGKQLDIGDRFGACNQNKPFICLAEGYRQDRESGKPLDEAYSRLLENALRHVHANDYDKSFVGELDDGWGRVPADPSSGARFADRFDRPATDADFVSRMRAVATAGLRPGAAPAALTGWKDEDFLSFDKTGGREKGNQKKLAAAEIKFTLSKTAWDKFAADKAAQKPPTPEQDNPVSPAPNKLPPAGPQGPS